MIERIRERYNQGYIRPDQLQRYVSLRVITQRQADEISGVTSSSEDFDA